MFVTKYIIGKDYRKSCRKKESTKLFIRDNSFSRYAKFSEKLTFLTPSYIKMIRKMIP